MSIAFIIFGWLGIVINFLFMLTAHKLFKSGETALLHLIICFVFVLLAPVPLSLYLSDQSDLMLMSTVFGYVFFIMIILTMSLQVGHLAYRNSQPDSSLWEDRDNWIIHGMLGDVFESLVNVIFHIWILLVAISFFANHNYFMGILMALFSLFIIRSLGILLKTVIKQPIPLLQYFKMNPFITNVETFFFFLSLVIWLTVQ